MSITTRSSTIGVALVGIALLFGAAGCAGLQNGNLEQVAPVSTPTATRAGNVYLVRGFIGVFSTGIDTLRDKLDEEGVRALVYQDIQASSLASTIREKYAGATNVEPLVLVGHSYGADDVINIARELNRDHIMVDLVVTLDPVTPRTVPPNVRKCINLYQSNGVWDNLPWLRGVPLKAEKPELGLPELTNANVRVDRTDLLEPGLDHFNIDKKPKVQGEVISLVLAACPERSASSASIETVQPAAAKLAPHTKIDTRSSSSGASPQALSSATPSVAPQMASQVRN